jgi:pimeloyl-ACP methyl ester carboxylesterase
MVKAIPNARLRVIRDAGHHVTIDQPTETTLAIAAFIDTQV